MTARKQGENLSDTRGNGFGIAFFKILLRVFGVRVCCAFVYVVAFFYALLDRQAYAAALPYLSSRFPQAGRLALRYHFFRLIVSQGHVMVMAQARLIGRHVDIRQLDEEAVRAAVSTCNHGVVMLISHVGPWQAGLDFLELFNRDVFLLIQANRNTSVARYFHSEKFHVIDNTGPFGGLLECMDALEHNGIVCIMGDRMPAEQEDSLTMRLCGREIPIPASPWLLAARCHSTIIPVFTIMRGWARCIEFSIGTPIQIPYNLPRKPKQTDFQHYIDAYSAALERHAIQTPYQIFHYDVLNS